MLLAELELYCLARTSSATSTQFGRVRTTHHLTEIFMYSPHEMRGKHKLKQLVTNIPPYFAPLHTAYNDWREIVSNKMTRSEWSIDSQKYSHDYAGEYDSGATEYEGIRYFCKLCTKSFIFTAEQQKHAYEIEKKYIRWFPKFCKECRDRLIALKQQDRQCQERWNKTREELSCDEEFLHSWMLIMKELNEFQIQRTMIVHVKSLIEKINTLSKNPE